MSLLPQWMARRHQSLNRNIYHCTVQKTASQWLRAILSDPRTLRGCGLTPFQFDHRLPDGGMRRPTERMPLGAFPDRTIVTPLYVDYASYQSLPKRTPCAAFFVMRDPRDVLVSWYFSIKSSHSDSREIGPLRAELQRLSTSDGLRFAVDYLNEYGLFQAMRSWANADVLRFRYEDLTGPDARSHLADLMRHCDICISADDLDGVLQTHSFEKLSGRRRGDEDVRAHFRKGVAGDWHNHFDHAVDAHFTKVAGDVVALWHYD